MWWLGEEVNRNGASAFEGGVRRGDPLSGGPRPGGHASGRPPQRQRVGSRLESGRRGEQTTQPSKPTVQPPADAALVPTRRKKLHWVEVEQAHAPRYFYSHIFRDIWRRKRKKVAFQREIDGGSGCDAPRISTPGAEPWGWASSFAAPTADSVPTCPAPRPLPHRRQRRRVGLGSANGGLAWQQNRPSHRPASRPASSARCWTVLTFFILCNCRRNCQA